MTETARAGRLASARRVAPMPGRLVRRLLRDRFLIQSVLLAMPIGILALGGSGQPIVLAALVGIFVSLQAVSGLASRRVEARRQMALGIGRFLLNVVFVACGQVALGGSGDVLALAYLPLVSVAASLGIGRGVAVGSAAIVLELITESMQRASQADALSRTAVFASVTVLVGLTTYIEVSRLRHARRRMRTAVLGDRRRAKQIAGVEAIGRILASAGPTDEALDRVVASIATQLGYQHVAIYLGDGSAVQLGAQRGYLEIPYILDGRRGIVGRVMQTGRAAVVPDVRADPDFWSVTPNVRSQMCVPLTADGEFLGLVSVESDTVRALDATDLRLLVAVGDRLATALVIGRERQRYTERADLFRHLHDFGEAVNGQLEPAQLYDAIVRAVPMVVSADICALVVLEQASGRYVLSAVTGTDANVLGAEVRSGEGMAGRAIRDRALVVDEQFTSSSYPASVAEIAQVRPGPMHAAAVPLVREGAVVGALSVIRHDVGRAFSELEREALALIAEQVAMAVANAFLHAEVSERAVRDPLTGLFNRRYLDPALDQLMAQRSRVPDAERSPLAMIMFDFDHFSELNNRYGHQAGDAVLRAFGAILLGRKRASDIIARFGGEEFAAVLYRATLDDAVRIAEQVREQLAARPIEGPDGEELSVTVSAGCAAAGPETDTAASLLRAADVALYMAKRAGRNRVVAA
ncbi:MAG: diguanylate cyclase [Candidatus Limnocylindria bacterium]